MSRVSTREEARAQAIEWQADFNNHNYTWSELFYFCEYFEKLGEKFGLLEEFHENGII